jgi:hypothetical protein
MKRDRSHFLSLRRLIVILDGLLLIVFSTTYFFDASAQTDAIEKPSQQNLVNGRLAFTRRISGPTFPDGRILTSNPDGSGLGSLPVPLLPTPVEPA